MGLKILFTFVNDNYIQNLFTMVNSEQFAKRLQKIMDHYGISATSFADAMAIGRSSISHLISGRNKPSLEFVMKLIQAYPEVDLFWLLYGKGQFPKVENTAATDESKRKELQSHKDKSIQPDLFSTVPTDSVEKNQNFRQTYDSKEEKLGEVSQIVYFYTNGTFRIFTPE